MKEYIDRAEYRERLSDLESWCQDLRKPGLTQALQMFDEIPAADVTEVIPCRECKHYDMGVCLKIYSDGNMHTEAWQPRRPEDFCSYGERKETE
jgi:hypothetical protein